MGRNENKKRVGTVFKRKRNKKISLKAAMLPMQTVECAVSKEEKTSEGAGGIKSELVLVANESNRKVS